MYIKDYLNDTQAVPVVKGEGIGIHKVRMDVGLKGGIRMADGESWSI